MSQSSFHNLRTLEEEAEKLGKRAMELGLISSFSCHFFADCWQFSLPNTPESELLTPCGSVPSLQKTGGAIKLMGMAVGRSWLSR